ncbi:MAG: hypothetical protein SH850_15525 [Planctomycetaceae bacterium]|nr:hypothetical protein [Planctomycetaceae bacterium]
MSRKLFDEIVEGIAREHEAKDLDRDARAARDRAEQEFRQSWDSTYPDHRDFDDQEASAFADRMLRLGEVVRERFWDYRLAEELLDTDLKPTLRLAGIALLNASFGLRSDVIHCLKSGRPYLNGITTAHSDTLNHLFHRSTGGLPLTPPISQRELASFVGERYDKVRGDIKAGRWKSAPAESHQRLRRWNHRDKATQTHVLRRIRELFPKKVWSGYSQ